MAQSSTVSTSLPVGSTFQCAPLASADSSIRLIQVLPTLDSGGRLQCELQYADLDASPKYSALSYVWGEVRPNAPHHVLVNGSNFPVQANLHRFLGSARFARPNTWFWIDAMSINQADMEERNSQVKLMGRIFEDAETVLSFVPDGEVRGGLRALQALAQIEAGEMNLPEGAQVTLDQGVHGAKGYGMDDLLGHLNDLCWAKYFSRTWIVQEVSLARTINLTDGTSTASWATLQRCLAAIQQATDLPDQTASFLRTCTASKLQDSRTGLRRSSLVAILTDFGSLDCSDFHDKVYGLLSLADNGHYYQADYRLDAWNHFLRTLRFCRDRGAAYAEEAQLFLAGRTIFNALELNLDSLIEQATHAGASGSVKDFSCRAIQASFKKFKDDNFELRDIVECSRCHQLTLKPRTASGNRVFCLTDEGTDIHLAFPKKVTQSLARGPKLAVFIRTFPVVDEVKDRFEWKTKRITPERFVVHSELMNMPELDAQGLFHLVQFSPTAFLRILDHQRRSLDEVLPREGRTACIVM